MNFSLYAGIAIVPTLSRLVLSAAFVIAGYTKVFTPAEFEATADGKGAANVLHGLGVNLTPAAAPSANGAMRDGSAGDHEWRIVRASYRAESEQATATEQPPAGTTTGEGTVPEPPPTPPASPTATTPATSAASAPATDTVAAGGTLAPGKYTAPSLHVVTHMVASMNWPMPVMQGWACALTELIGGALLLIGLFSRVWGLGLSIVMGVAFYLTSLPVLQSTSILELQPLQSASLFVQVSLFVLAFGIMLTGAGPLSLDRILFERKPSPPMPQHDDRKMR